VRYREHSIPRPLHQRQEELALPDILHVDDFPVRRPSLFFGGLAYAQPEWLKLWRKLNLDPTVEEVIRSFPIRQPVLWV